MNAVNVNGCSAAIGEHRRLFDEVRLVSPNQAVVFIVKSITDAGPFGGCAAHPQGRPGVVITEAAARGRGVSDGAWVLAHEIGHLLGIDEGDSRNLMCHPATAITAMMPQLSSAQCATVEQSRLLGRTRAGDRSTAGPSAREIPGRELTSRAPASRELATEEIPLFRLPPPRLADFFNP